MVSNNLENKVNLEKLRMTLEQKEDEYEFFQKLKNKDSFIIFLSL